MFLSKKETINRTPEKKHVHGKIFLSAMSSLKSNCLWKPTDRLEENVFIDGLEIFLKSIRHQSLFYVKLSIEYNGWLIFQSIYINYTIPVAECGFLAITIHLLNYEILESCFDVYMCVGAWMAHVQVFLNNILKQKIISGLRKTLLCNCFTSIFFA